MSRRASVPGAAELFRSTAPAADSLAAEPEQAPARVAALEVAPDPVEVPAAPTRFASAPSSGTAGAAGVRRTTRAGRGSSSAQPSGRERHEEKITVYCSPHELVALETARLHLRAEHGLAVDRGRIVREALAVVLADLEAKGESSILVRRLRELAG